jgi:hypothetical protein
MNDEEVGRFIATAAQTSIIVSNLAFAKLLGEGIVLTYETPAQEDKEIILACRPSGHALLAIFLGNSHKVYMLEVYIDEKASEYQRKLSLLELSNKEDAESFWCDMMDEVDEWAQGKVEKIVIGEKLA